MTNPLERDLDEVVSNSADIWERLRGCSIFVTGGTGFVGTWMMECLAWADLKLELNIRAVLLTRNPEGFRKKAPCVAERFELLCSDCGDFEFPIGEFTYVIHAATEAPTPANYDHPAGAFVKDVH